MQQYYSRETRSVPWSSLRIPRVQPGKASSAKLTLYTRLGFRHAILQTNADGHYTLAWPENENAPGGKELLRLRDSDGKEEDKYGMPVEKFHVPHYQAAGCLEPLYRTLGVEHIVVKVNGYLYVCHPSKLGELSTRQVRDGAKEAETHEKWSACNTLAFPTSLSTEALPELFELAKLCGHEYKLAADDGRWYICEVKEGAGTGGLANTPTPIAVTAIGGQVTAVLPDKHAPASAAPPTPIYNHEYFDRMESVQAIEAMAHEQAKIDAAAVPPKGVSQKTAIEDQKPKTDEKKIQSATVSFCQYCKFSHA
jgi:hypothetical protein